VQALHGPPGESTAGGNIEMNCSARGYCIKYNPAEVYREYQQLLRQHYKADAAVRTLGRKYCKAPSTIYLILKQARPK
jgi:hypothetical protein